MFSSWYVTYVVPWAQFMAYSVHWNSVYALMLIWGHCILGALFERSSWKVHALLSSHYHFLSDLISYHSLCHYFPEHTLITKMLHSHSYYVVIFLIFFSLFVSFLILLRFFLWGRDALKCHILCSATWTLCSATVAAFMEHCVRCLCG